jgi:hypothetical protein
MKQNKKTYNYTQVNFLDAKTDLDKIKRYAYANGYRFGALMSKIVKEFVKNNIGN